MTDTTKPLVNKVAQKALITLDLEEYFPKPEDLALIDLKDYLFKGLILREADFREAVKNTDWSQYKSKYVALHCTTNAIIPMWAYMLVASYLHPFAKEVVFGDEQKLVSTLLLKNLEAVNGEAYTDKRVVVKGCGDLSVPEAAYVAITNKLRPYVKSIMYGEPCSTVPIYKKK